MTVYASQWSKPDCENNFHVWYIWHSMIVKGNIKPIDQATATVNGENKIKDIVNFSLIHYIIWLLLQHHNAKG